MPNTRPSTQAGVSGFQKEERSTHGTRSKMLYWLFYTDMLQKIKTKPKLSQFDEAVRKIREMPKGGSLSQKKLHRRKDGRR